MILCAPLSAKGNAWSAIATLDGVKDKDAGIQKVKQGLEKYLQNIEYDDPTKTEGGALLITGSGKAKKAGVDVVFAAGVFDAGPGKLAGVAFVVDENVDDHYKEAVRVHLQDNSSREGFHRAEARSREASYQ